MAVDPSLWRGSIERRFYTAAAVATALLVLIGFARTYYLKFASSTRRRCRVSWSMPTAW